MRRGMFLTGLIILILGIVLLVLGNIEFFTQFDRLAVRGSRFPVLLILLLIVGSVLLILGFIMPPSDKKESSFRIGY